MLELPRTTQAKGTSVDCQTHVLAKSLPSAYAIDLYTTPQAPATRELPASRFHSIQLISHTNTPIYMENRAYARGLFAILLAFGAPAGFLDDDKVSCMTYCKYTGGFTSVPIQHSRLTPGLLHQVDICFERKNTHCSK
jgi:hypothetical protein